MTLAAGTYALAFSAAQRGNQKGAGQTFQVSVDYPSGLVPVIGTGVTDDTTNPLKVGIKLDGVLIRPKQ